MKRTLLRYRTPIIVLSTVLLSSSTLYAQAKIDIDKERWVTVGGALRTSFRTTETSPGYGDYVQKISLENARLYFNGQPHKDFQVEFNTVYSAPDDPQRRLPAATNQLQVLDAVVKYAPRPFFNIWMGRHLRLADRSSLDTPYFLSIYDYPDLVYHYPVTFVGLRDNGVSVSGQVDDGKLKYSFGMYDGARTVLGAKDNMLYAARATVNLLDSEPGYYNQSTYYGDKNILSIGFAIQHQGDIVIDNTGVPAAFTGYNVDLLAEKKLSCGCVISLEGGFYNYDYQSTARDGSAFFAQAAFLFPKQMGIGKLQPVARYQDYQNSSQFDIGANYVIAGHNARLSAIYSLFDNGANSPAASKTNQFKVGTQFQF